MSNIKVPLDESISRLEDGINKIQVEYNFLSRYLEEDEQDDYAKAFALLESISQVLRIIENEEE